MLAPLAGRCLSNLLPRASPHGMAYLDAGRLPAGPAFLRVRTSESCNLSSSSRHHGRTRRKTSCAILHGVESWPRASVGNDGKHSRTIRRHSRCKPAVSDTSERLSERLRGVLCAVSLCAFYRSQIRGSNAIFHGCEQSLQWVANDRNVASWTRLHGTTELHLEPLHGHRLKRRIPAILGWCNSLASPRRLSTGLWPLRLRHPEQS